MLDYNCWKCGEVLQDQKPPYSRRAECSHCGAELHVCRMCRDYDKSLISQCRNDDAEPPREKDRANFCEYFDPSPKEKKPSHQYSGLDHQEDSGDDTYVEIKTARQQLAELFGDDDKSDKE